MIQELFDIVSGRMREFVLKHDTVRAVQAAVKYANVERRKQIAREMQGSYAQLAESRYAKFLIGKLLEHGDEEIRDMIVPEFYGRIKRMINHPEASWILDDVYRVAATKEQKAVMLREWYGPSVTIMEGTEKKTGDLAEILEEEPNKRGPILKNLLVMINPLVQKRMTGFTMLHDAMLQYFLNLKPETEEWSEFFELVKGDETGDLLKNMAFTKSGSRLACLLLAHGSPKDRKQILKVYKGSLLLMSGNEYAHTVLLAAYDVIDDTVMTSKAIFPELFGASPEAVVADTIAAANNPHARLTILYLFEGPSKSLFQASHAHTLGVLDEIHEIRKSKSKKDAETRRKELVVAVSPQLLKAIELGARDLTASAFGGQFTADILIGAAGDKTDALEAVANLASGDPDSEAVAETKTPDENNKGLVVPHLANTIWGGRMLKSLIAGGKYDRKAGKVQKAEPALNFADVLYPKIKEWTVKWATGGNSFVVVALMEADDFSSLDEVRATLRTNRKTLEKAATEETAEQVEKREARDALKAADGGKKDKKGKKGKVVSEAPVGNVGCKLLLQKL